MKRLYSYYTYFVIGIIPIVVVVVLVFMNKALFSNLWFLFLLVLLAYVFLCLKYKRVYIKDSELHIFSLFSDYNTVVNKEQIVSISRWVRLDYWNYKIKYIAEDGKVKTAYFLREFFTFDMKKAIAGLIN